MYKVISLISEGVIDTLTFLSSVDFNVSVNKRTANVLHRFESLTFYINESD